MEKRINKKSEPRKVGWAQEFTFKHQGFQVLQMRKTAQCGVKEAIVAAEPEELDLDHLSLLLLEQLEETAAAVRINIQVQSVVRKAGASEGRSPRSPLPTVISEPLQLCHLLHLIHRVQTCSDLPGRQALAAPQGSWDKERRKDGSEKEHRCTMKAPSSPEWLESQQDGRKDYMYVTESFRGRQHRNAV